MGITEWKDTSVQVVGVAGRWEYRWNTRQWRVMTQRLQLSNTF